MFGDEFENIANNPDSSDLDVEVANTARELGVPMENIIVKDGVIERIIDPVTGDITFTEFNEEGVEGATGSDDSGVTGETPVAKTTTTTTGGSSNFIDVFTKAGYDLSNFSYNGKAADKITQEEANDIIAEQLTEARNVFQSQTEVDIINFLRTGKTPADLADYIINNDPKLQLTKMTDEQLVQKDLKDRYPEFNDDELKDELATLNETAIARRAKVLRDRAAASDLNIGKVAEEHNQIAQKEHIRQVKEITNVAVDSLAVAGIQLNDDMRNEILQEILTEDHNADSAFITDLADPEVLIELAFWKLYGPSAIKLLQDQLANAEKAAKEKFMFGLPNKIVVPAAGDRKQTVKETNDDTAKVVGTF